MIYFQIVNNMVPLVLPWSFIIATSNTKDYKAKQSGIVYLFIFFMALFFPIYYIFDLLQERHKKL